MYGREQMVLLRHYLEWGLSKVSLARELGVTRRTIYHWIETGQLERELDGKPVCYGPRAARCAMGQGRRCPLSSMPTGA